MKKGESALTRKLRSTKFGARYLEDIHFRNRVSLHVGVTVNLGYIILKLTAGIYYRSVWLLSLSFYYILLALTRIFLLRSDIRDDARAQLRRYRACGFVLLLMNQALTGIVVFMVRQNKGFDYPGVLIYAMAFYSFYAVITATVNVVKTHKHQSPVLSAAKAVNLVAALVSILSLTTAMLARFGENDAPEFRRTMTVAVGGGVCTAVIAMAVCMIWRANKIMRNNAF